MRHCNSSLQLTYTFITHHETLFQSTVDKRFQNTHKTQKTEKASTSCVYNVIYSWLLRKTTDHSLIIKISHHMETLSIHPKIQKMAIQSLPSNNRPIASTCNPCKILESDLGDYHHRPCIVLGHKLGVVVTA